MLFVWVPEVKSTTDTVPVLAAPVLALATMGVLNEEFVKSELLAGRPPSLLTYAVEPEMTTCRGALPTGIWLIRVLLAVSTTPSALAPFRATYNLDPSPFKAMPDGLGYFHWRGNINLYIEVLSWTKVLKDADMRNRAFFYKLGIEGHVE